MDKPDPQSIAHPASAVELVFCGPSVDPGRITALLEVTPTASLKKGQTGYYSWNSQPYVASSGEWMLSINEYELSQSLEECLVRWASWLENHRAAIRELTHDGYVPYLQINKNAVEENLSIFIDVALLKKFAEVGVAICVDAGADK